MIDETEEHEKFCEIMEALAAFYDVQISATRTGLYFEAMRDLSLLQIQVAAIQIMRYRKWNTLPKPGEFREMIDAPTLTAFEAWIEVQGLVKKYGNRRRTHTDPPIPFSSPRVEIACDYVGGVHGLASCAAENDGMNRAHFTKAYDSLTERQPVRTFMTHDDAATSLARVYALIAHRNEKETP